MKGNNQKTWAILQKRHEMFKRTTRHEKPLKKGKNSVMKDTSVTHTFVICPVVIVCLTFNSKKS